MKKHIVKCKKCGCYIDLRLGEFSPAEYADREGTKEETRSPGDYDNICDVCCYG